VRKAAGRLLASGGALAIALVLLGPVFASSSGCVGNECESDFEDYPGPTFPDQSLMLDENTWASSPLVGPWLPYPHQRYWGLHTTALFGNRVPDHATAFISPDETGPVSVWSEAAGNLAEWSQPTPGYILLHNDTCADYSVRVVITFAALDGGPDSAADASLVDAMDGAEGAPDALDGGIDSSSE
jgi:hypothetical protein